MTFSGVSMTSFQTKYYKQVDNFDSEEWVTSLIYLRSESNQNYLAFSLTA